MTNTETDTSTSTTEAGLICPECEEPVVEKPPRGWITRTWEPLPCHSHHDGEPLCAVMTGDGYRTAEPVMPGQES